MIWPRSAPAELADFDPATKECTMNCGQHSADPRSWKECKFQCNECITVSPNDKLTDEPASVTKQPKGN